MTLEESIAEVLGDDCEDFLVVHIGNCQKHKGKCTCLPFRIPMDEARAMGAAVIVKKIGRWVGDARSD